MPETVAERLATLPPAERKALLRTNFTAEEAGRLWYEWRLWARPNQLSPPGEWRNWLIRSGRGGGKTRTGAQWIIDRAKAFPRYHMALVGRTVFDTRTMMVKYGESSIIACSPPEFRPEYNEKDRLLTWPNGAMAFMFSGDFPDQLRGPNIMSAWIDEFAKFRYPGEILDQLDMCVRVGPKPQVVFTTTPRRIPAIKRLLEDPQTVDTRYSTYDNRAYLSPQTLARLEARYKGTHLWRQEIEGEYIDEVEGALWSWDMLERNRVSTAPRLRRVVIGVDPQAEVGEDVSETGIVVVGLAAEKLNGRDCFFVLDDVSGNYTPEEWARKVELCYNKYDCDMIVAEVNQGGEMVASVIRNQNPALPVKKVHAKKGKYLRAEPVAMLAEQDRFCHVGTFPELEDQLTTYVPGEKSPDHMDAMVYAVTDLMGEEEVQVIVI